MSRDELYKYVNAILNMDFPENEYFLVYPLCKEGFSVGYGILKGKGCCVLLISLIDWEDAAKAYPHKFMAVFESTFASNVEIPKSVLDFFEAHKVSHDVSNRISDNGLEDKIPGLQLYMSNAC